MAAVMDRALTLADLPADIIRKIILLELESIDAMRLVSPRWNRHAFEYFQNRKDRPDIETFYLNVAHGKVKSLRMQISEDERRYFGVSSWTTIAKNQFCFGLFDSKFYQWFKKEPEEGTEPNLNTPFARCARLRTLIIKANLQNAASLDTIKEAIRGVTPKEIVIMDVPGFINEPFLLDLICPTATKHLTLYSDRGLAILGVDNAKRCSFYAESLARVPSIQLIMTRIPHEAAHRPWQQQLDRITAKINKAAPIGLGRIFSRPNLSLLSRNYGLRISITTG